MLAHHHMLVEKSGVLGLTNCFFCRIFIILVDKDSTEESGSITQHLPLLVL